MTRIHIAIAMIAMSVGAAQAATVENMDDKAYTLTVTEGGERSEIGIEAGQTISICPGGCFLTLPDGDRAALSGNETVEITGGRAKIK